MSLPSQAAKAPPTCKSGQNEPLAVVGFALRFPQEADSPDGFWRVMEARECVMTEWPVERLRLDAFHHRDESQPKQVAYT